MSPLTKRRILLLAIMLAANAVVAGLWWIWTGPEAYLWARASPEGTATVRDAGRAVFWARWPLWALLLNAAVAAALLLRAGRRGRAAAVFATAVLSCACVKQWGGPRVAGDYCTLFRLQ